MQGMYVPVSMHTHYGDGRVLAREVLRGPCMHAYR